MKKILLYIVCLLFIAPAKINAQNKISPAMQAPGIASFVSAPESTTVRKSRERSQSNSAPQRVNAHPMRMAGAPLTAPITGFFREDFEGGFPPAGWQVVDVLDPTYLWEQSPLLPYTGTNSALIHYSNVGVSAEDWMITPQYTVAVTDSFSFHLALIDINFPPDTTFILISTTDSNLTSFTTTLDVLAEDLNYPLNDTGYNYYSYSLAAFAGQNIYIAFVNTNIFGDGVYIDRVSVGTKPPDAAAISIDIPKFAAIGTFSPKATFKNDGDSVVSFPVVMTITGGYSSTKNINNLAPGALMQVTFDPYNAAVPGSQVISIQTMLAGDTFLGDDTLTSSALFMETFTNYGWSQRTPLPEARYGAATGAINNNTASDMYVFGGFKNFVISDSINRFMPVNNSWAPINTIPKMPKGAFLASAATVKNKIYITGGYNPNFSPINNNQIYDPFSNSWSNGFSMSSAVGDYAIGVFNDSIIYYFGGYSGSLYRNIVQLFVPSSFTWIPGTSIPVTGASWRGGIIRNKIVITGGTNSTSNALVATYIGTIDPANPYIITWAQGPDYPGGPVTRLAGGASLDTASGLILFTGGDPTGFGTNALDYTFAYDINVNQWKVGPPKPTPANNLCNFTAVVDNDSLYMVAVGGNGPNGPLTANEWLNLGPIQLVIGLNENNNLNIGLTCSPNPFNDFTNIKFKIDKNTRVRVSIKDVLGNELEVLSDKTMNQGNIVLTWNASSYASGIYICSVTVDGKTSTQKLVRY